MDSINTFEGGMSSDISKLYQSNKQYLSATNLRPVTTYGGSNAALVNVKGNACKITFPDLQDIYKLRIDRTLSNNGVITITINGQTTNQITITENTTTADISAYLKVLSNCYTGSYSSTKTFEVNYNSNDIFISQQPYYFGCEVNSSVTPTITINQISGTATVKFVLSDNTTTALATPYIDAIVGNLKVIGSTYIGETFYLFTCPETYTTGLSQIWEFEYNELTYISNLKLLYNSYLNFSINYPIAPSASVGRYETPDIQRIYWSDNNNPVRSLNVKADNIMAIDVDLINLRPSVEMSVPTLYNIISGGAVDDINTVSTYQCAYRLLKNNGAITNYSPVSNIIYPTLADLDDYKTGEPNFCNISGEIGTVNKRIQWEVRGIDTNFDTIEFVIIIRATPNSDFFTIFKFDEQSINNQSTIYTTFLNDTADHTLYPISLEEFLIENTTFTHAKTIEQKDNILFFANIKNQLSDVIENYDARTFRFASGTDNIKIKNFETDLTTDIHTISGNDYSGIPETYDAIPAYNLGLHTSDDALYDHNYRFQRNSSVLGGEGPNIKYTFGNVLLKSDENDTALNGQNLAATYQGTEHDDAGSSQNYKYGYRKAGTRTIPAYSTTLYDYNTLAVNQTYRTQNVKETMAAEFYSGLFKSYQHNEIYRFGILFYSKTGTTYFVKWIGDIKFPNYSDSIDPSIADRTDSGNQVTDFRSMYRDLSGAYCNIPYIKFDVTIPETLANEISGYQIVRVPRTENDRTIAETGLINQIGTNPATTDLMLPVMPDYGGSGSPPATTLATYQYDLNPGPSDAKPCSNRAISFHSFSYLVDGNANKIDEDDRLVITEKYSAANTKASVNPYSTTVYSTLSEMPYLTRFYVYKNNYYNVNGTGISNSVFKIKEAGWVDINGALPLVDLGVTYYNHNSLEYADGGGPSGAFGYRIFAKGNKSIILTLNSTTPITWSTYDEATSKVNGPNTTITYSSKLLAMHYKPSLLKNQYGGRTNISRASNEYISCGAYMPVSNSGTYSIKTFGGDIYHGILDIQRAIAEPHTNNKGTAALWFFPTQSPYNVDLRTGISVNRNYNPSDTGLTTEAFGCPESYMYENNLTTYVPKPFNFNATTIFNNRVYWSNIKNNGETSDSFTSIPALNYYDVDGNYGEITALITLKNNVHFTQERAFGLLYINPQTVIPDQNNQPLKLGSSSVVLEKHFYTSTDAGSKHQWSVSKSNTAITFVDSRSKKIYLFNGESLNPTSDTKNMKGFMNKVLHDDILIYDNPLIEKSILTTYDFENNEFLYTFLNDYHISTERTTLAYSDLIGAFSTYYSFTPYMYINNHNKLYSISSFNDSKIFLHNVGIYGTFYELQYSSNIKLNSNPNPLYTKIYDNLSWITDVNTEIELDDYAIINIPNATFTTLRCYNDTQNTDVVFIDTTPITGNTRKVEGEWNTQVPRNKVNYDVYPQGTYSIFDPTVLTKTEFGEQLRDKYMIVELEYPNGASQFILHAVKSAYRISSR